MEASEATVGRRVKIVASSFDKPVFGTIIEPIDDMLEYFEEGMIVIQTYSGWHIWTKPEDVEPID